jgi:hypothetical protein
LPNAQHADRVRLVAQELALSGWPAAVTKTLQEAADALEEEGWRRCPPGLPSQAGFHGRFILAIQPEWHMRVGEVGGG